MVGSRIATASLGVAVSLLASGVLWWVTGSLILFLVVPFVPFLFRTARSPEPPLTCPVCGYQTSNPDYEYCPSDGHRLE